MAENKVKYYVRIDDKYVEADMDQAEKKVSSGGSKVAGAVKGIGLAVGSALVGATTAAVAFGSEFETSMAKASTLIDTGTVDMGKLEEQILALSDSSGIAASDLGNSMYNALSAGIDLGEDNANMLAFLESSSKLAKAGFTDLDTALTATAKTMNAYGLEGEDAMNRVQKVLMQTQNNGITTVGELGSVLAQVTPTAAAMGVEFEQVGAALANMTAQGTPAAQATTQLNGLIAELGKNGTTASKNLEAAAAGTEYAGMSFQDMMAAGVPLNDVLDMMGTYADETGVGMLDMFSSIEAGKAALALSGENSAQFTANLKSMSTEADVVGAAFDKVSDTSAEKFAKMMNELKNAAIELFGEMLPIIEFALPLLQTVLDGAIDAVLTAVDCLKSLATWLGENEGYAVLIAIALGTLTAAIIAYNIVQNAAAIATAVSTAATAAFGAVMAFVTSPITLVILAIGALIAVVWLLIDNWDVVSKFLAETWEWIKETAISIFTSIQDFFTQLWTCICDTFTNVWNFIKDFFFAIWDNLVSGVMGYLEIFKNTFTSIFTLVSDIISNNVNTWLSVFTNLIDFIKNVFTGNWEAAWENVKNIFSAIATGIGDAFKAPINFIIDCINGFINGLSNIKIPDWIPGIGGKSFSIPVIPRLKKGMDFVPSDFFPAYLDYGERVLTQEENAAFNAMGGIDGMQQTMTTASASDAAVPNTVINYYEGDTIDKTQNITFEEHMQAPDEIARALRTEMRYGLAGATR